MSVEIKKSACHFCGYNCSLLVHVEDGKIVKLEGNPDHPMSRGFMCERPKYAIKWLYHPDQILHPLKRVGERGEGKWQQIPHDQAMGEIADKLAEIKEKYGPEALAASEGTYRSDHFWARARFFNLFGNPQNIATAGVICALDCAAVNQAVSGESSWFLCDYPKTNCIVLWGVNQSESWLITWSLIRKRMQQGNVKLIVIDPRVTRVAQDADMILQLRPGTDGALAMGWLHVIINEKLYDKEFVEKWTHGFDKLTERVQEYTPSRVAEITGLTEEQIVTSARMYATNSPATMERGVATDLIGRNSGRVEQARLALRAITGNIDVPGGNLLPEPGPKKDGQMFRRDAMMELSEKSSPEQRKKQIGSDTYKLMTWPGWELMDNLYRKTFGVPHPQGHMLASPAPLIWRAILEGKPYHIRAMITWASNPMLWASNTNIVYDALKSPNLELHVVRDYWMTPTAALADYVLPVASWMERPMCTTLEDWLGIVRGGERAIPPLGERTMDFDFWKELGIRLGQGEYWPWETYEELIEYRLEPLGMDYEEFVEKGGFFASRRYRKYEETGFATPTGKIELYSLVFEQLGYDPLPYYEEPSESPVSTPEVAKEYPLILITGGRFMPMLHSEHRQLGIGMRERHPDPLMDIHPETAQKLGIEHGDWAYIETKRGKIKQKANVTETILSSVINVEASWWFPEAKAEEPSLHGLWESNANVLTIDDPESCDPLTGGWYARGMLCKVYKA